MEARTPPRYAAFPNSRPHQLSAIAPASKLNSFRDGARILLLIFDLTRNERPLQFFGLVGLGLIIAALAFAVPLAETYFQTGLVPRLPTAVLSVGLIITGFLSCLAGLMLDTVATMRHEMKRLTYLSFPPPSVGGSLRAAPPFVDVAA